MTKLTSGGGRPNVRDVMNYSTPYGIKNQTTGPGLGQNNYGNCGTQSKSSNPAGTSGSPGIGPATRNGGMQGKR